MTEHTPGPWHLEKPRRMRKPNGFSHNAKAQLMAGPSLILGTIDGPQNLDLTEEWAANARLIAASPLLLEALEGLVAALAPNHSVNPLWVEARAAIAKARGE